MGCPFPLKIAPSHGGSGPPSNTWFPGPTGVLNPNGMSISLAVFAEQVISVTDGPTDHATQSVRIVRTWYRGRGLIILITIPVTMLMVLLSQRGHCQSPPSSFDECTVSAKWSPTLKPSQPTLRVSPTVGCYHPHPPSSFISITQPESWYTFYHPTEGGRLSRLMHCNNSCSPYRDCISQWLSW